MLVLQGQRGSGLLTFSPDGRTLAARYENGLQLWRGLPEPEFQAISTSPIGWMAFAPDGHTLYLDGPISWAYDLTTGIFTELPNPDGKYRFLALSPDGQFIVAACSPENQPESEYAFRCWRPEQVGTGKPQWSAPACEVLGHPLFLPDGRFVTLVCNSCGFWWIQWSKTGKWQAQSIPTNWCPNREAVSPDGAYIAGTTKGSRAAAWLVGMLSETRIELRNDSRKAFTDVAFTASSRHLALSSSDGTVKLYDTATWRLARTYDWGIGKLVSVAFSRDGTVAAAGSDTGRVVVWDVDE